MENNFSFSELYDVKLKATYPMEIKNRNYEVGEVITTFDRIQIANFNEIKKYTAAEGGFDNRPHVIWEDTKQIDFTFSQGVFSQLQFSMLGNARLLEIEKGENILISKREVKESDDYGNIELEEVPSENIFIYKVSSGEKIKNYRVEGKTLVLEEPYQSFVIDYEYTYNNRAEQAILGRRLISGFVLMEGKTRVKDDVTGNNRTGIIKIPKLKLMSDLSIRLGTNANPVIANFRASGFPIGDKGSKKVMEMIFLNDDIDSDM